MKILVLNCGSSSIKYQLFDIDKKLVMAKGIVEKIGLNESILKNKRNDGDKILLTEEIPNHTIGIEKIFKPAY